MSATRICSPKSQYHADLSHFIFVDSNQVEDAMKSCFKCGEVKSLSEFYKHPRMADGHVNKCKECNKRDVRQNYKDNHNHYMEYERKRSHSPHRVKARGYSNSGKIGLYCVIPHGHPARKEVNNPNELYILRNPKKRQAQIRVKNAIRNGKLIRQPCEVCGTTENIHAHHCNYDKPLEVMWLCSKHHREWHKEHGDIV